MRYLGIDYGHKKVGLALSDEGGSLAFPNAVMPNDEHLIKNISALCEKESVGAIIIGESKDYQGQDNPIMAQIRTFADHLAAESGRPVEFEMEFLTSRAAARTVGTDARLDARAAALILQSYLDRKNI